MGEGVARADEIAADLAARLGRVRAAMAARGIGGLLVYATGQHNMLRTDQLRYLTDFKLLGPQAVLLVPAHGTLHLLLTPAWDLARAREIAPGLRIDVVGPAGLPRLAAARAREVLEGPLGFSGGDVMPARAAGELLAALDRPIIEATDLIPSVATTRTPLEIARLRRAAAIADEGFRRLVETARAGMREYELHAELEAALQAAGSEDNFGLIAAGAHNVAIRPSTDRRLEPGDVIVGEITPCFEGQFAQLCRTLVLGEPTALQREKYELLLAAQRAGMAAAVPGATAGDVVAAVNRVLEAAGYGAYCRQPYMRTRGHGLGFGGVVPLEFNADAATVIAKDMTFIIHPNQYLPETGYLMLGDTVLIGERGPEALTKTPLRLFSSAG